MNIAAIQKVITYCSVSLSAYAMGSYKGIFASIFACANDYYRQRHAQGDVYSSKKLVVGLVDLTCFLKGLDKTTKVSENILFAIGIYSTLLVANALNCYISLSGELFKTSRPFITLTRTTKALSRIFKENLTKILKTQALICASSIASWMIAKKIKSTYENINF